jgi:hypothetical protein
MQFEKGSIQGGRNGLNRKEKGKKKEIRREK